jgi:hypothetical protein
MLLALEAEELRFDRVVRRVDAAAEAPLDQVSPACGEHVAAIHPDAGRSDREVAIGEVAEEALGEGAERDDDVRPQLVDASANPLVVSAWSHRLTRPPAQRQDLAVPEFEPAREHGGGVSDVELASDPDASHHAVQDYPAALPVDELAEQRRVVPPDHFGHVAHGAAGV